MKKNGIAKKLLLFSLITVMVLTMQGMSVFAEPLQMESQPESLGEQSEALVGQSVSQNELSKIQSVSQNELLENQSVSQNGLSESQSVSQNGLPELKENNRSDAGIMPAASGLTKNILEQCIVHGQNPQGVTVNLFDYWQADGSDPEKEVPHDYTDDSGKQFITYNSGISKEHLLRFGYRDNGGCNDCGDYGAWNQYYQSYDGTQDPADKGKLYPGIVQNRLGADGFPKLNLSSQSNFGQYAIISESTKYLSQKDESLVYLFSLNTSYPYRAVYENVQGLFQRDSNGYYYYDSTKNFASYNKSTNSFVLYNSPGVAQQGSNGAEFCGQFFPFNTAYDVFDSYITNTDGKHRLIYKDVNNRGVDGADSNGYTPVSDGNNSYIQCYASLLNHYLGMTLEVPFMQPKNGLVNGNPMVFRFSGDDDVWVFIDDVLVADLGGLHDAYSLEINFSNGSVDIWPMANRSGNGAQHGNLLNSFKEAYPYDSNMGGVAFKDETFADNTVHTLKMFYLERGHMASNLSLGFNIQPVNTDPVKEVNQDGNIGEPELYAEENTDETAESILPPADATATDSIEIPQTGDDSMIWWWAVLCIISFLGIGAVVCNLIFVRRKQKKIITEGKRKKHSARK